MTQAEALKILKTGANVFLTGEPGSGKTFVINEYVKYLQQAKVEVAITASTGIAATHLGGMTIHSWSGIGISKFISRWDMDRISTNQRIYERVRLTKVLVIDEISMLDSLTLTAVDASCRTLRRNSEPFGGLQVVFVGDFFHDGISGGDEELISFDLIDLVMSLVKKGEIKYLYHQQEAMWNKMFSEYLGRETMNRMIEENIIKGFIEL